jgi:hypothetical protein
LARRAARGGAGDPADRQRRRRSRDPPPHGSGKGGLPQLPSIRGRVSRLVEGWTSRSPSTATQQASYDAAADAFEELLAELRVLVEEDLKRLQDDLEAAGAPWTPGRVPSWTRE